MIQEIVARLTAAGADGGVVLCPYCGGGKRQRRTLSIHNRDGVWLWLCHRATCAAKGCMAGDPADLLKTKRSSFQPRPLPDWPTRFPEASDPIGARIMPLIEHGDLNDFSGWAGLRVRVDDPTVHIWEVLGTDGDRRGSQTRTAQKQILSWREVDRPWISVYRPRGEHDWSPADGPIVITEDCLSAALLGFDGLTAVSLMGTNLTIEAAKEIAEFARGNRIFVALDPDHAGIHAIPAVLSALRSYGAQATAWYLPIEINRMTRDRRVAEGEWMTRVSL